jgi:DNA adenine methylase Dam
MKYINTPYNFTGSKYKLLEQILPEMDYTKKYFIDLFAGGGSVFSNVLDKYDKILANDIIEDLIGIHKGVIYNSEEFINNVKKLVVQKDDKEGFNELRESYNKNKTPEKLYALMLCSTNNMMRFNLKFNYNQTFGKRTYNTSTEKKLEEYISFVGKYQDKLFFTSKSFYDIKIKKPAMVYIDPPYGYVMLENGEIGNKQISEAGYNAYYSKEDDLKLYDYILELDKDGHSFMLSGLLEHDGKKSWILNKLIQDNFNYKELKFDYNGVSRNGKKESVEIIIKNYIL